MTGANLPYRDGGAAHGGLPFPRTGMTAWIVAVALVAATGFCFPMLLLGRSPSAIWMSFKDGGGSSYLLLVSMPVVLVVVAVLSALGIRGKPIPPAAIVGAALAPALIALSGTALARATMLAAIRGESIDPSQKMRIVFEGTQESMAPLQFGAALCAFSLGAAAVGCAGIAASVDRARIGVPLPRTWSVALVVPLLGLVAGLVLRVLTRSLTVSPLAFALSIVSLIVVAVVAGLGARSAVALRDWHDAKEAGRMLGALLAAAFASALALWLLDRAAMIGVERTVLSACSGESVDLGQRARILMEGNDEARAFGVLSGLHVACAVGAFVPALVLGSTRGERRRHPLGVGGVVTLSLLALGAVGFLGVYAQSLGTVAKEAATLHAPSYPVSLPVVKNLGATHPMSGHAVVFTKQDNVLERLEKDVSLYPGRYTFAADRDARVVALIALLEARDVQGSRLELVVTEEHPAPPPRDIDPDVLAMLGPEPLVVSVSIGGSSARVPSITFQSGNQSLGVQRVHGELVGVELGPNLQKDLYEALGEAPDVVTIYVEGKTTVGALSQVIDALASSQRGPDVRVGVTGYTEERLAPLRGRR